MTRSTLLSKLPFDLTRSFSYLVISIMLLRFIVAKQSLSEAITGFIGHPIVLLSFTICYAFYRRLKYSPVAEWYFWNAWLYHAVMDGSSGTFRLVPVVVQQYDVLDQRFPQHHVVPWLVGFIELFCMAPMCLVTLYYFNTKWRAPLELLTSAFQLFGMLMFVGAEVYEGQYNIPALDPVGWNGYKFNLYHLTYYWFGFWFCNLVWGVVPVLRIWWAMQECVQQQQPPSTATTSTNNKKGT